MGTLTAANRATLWTLLCSGFVQRYEALQGELVRHLRFRIDWTATQIAGAYIEDAADVDAPSVLVQSTQENVKDLQAQEAYLYLLIPARCDTF